MGINYYNFKAYRWKGCGNIWLALDPDSHPSLGVLIVRKTQGFTVLGAVSSTLSPFNGDVWVEVPLNSLIVGFWEEIAKEITVDVYYRNPKLKNVEGVMVKGSPYKLEDVIKAKAKKVPFEEL